MALDNINNPEINLEFLSHLKDSFDFLVFFENNSEGDVIIRPESSHEFHFKTFRITPVVGEYYNKLIYPEIFPRSEALAKETRSLERPSFIGDNFSIKILNAYYYRPHFLRLIDYIICNELKKEYKTLSDLLPYFIEYEKGFVHGYRSFLAVKFGYSFPGYDLNVLNQKIFDYTIDKYHKTNFPFEGVGNTEILQAYEHGRVYGYLYEAWRRILFQSEYFESLFEGLQDEQIKPAKLLPNDLKGIENKFDHKPIEDVYKFFDKELVKTNWLTTEDLYRFLKMAFDQKKSPHPNDKIKFINDPPKKVIRNIFYRYYKDINGKTKSRVLVASLLGDYFFGYETKKVDDNFSK